MQKDGSTIQRVSSTLKDAAGKPHGGLHYIVTSPDAREQRIDGLKKSSALDDIVSATGEAP